MIERKRWSEYTDTDIEKMRIAVMHSPPDAPFTPEYAAAYLGVSSSTLQYWRSHKPKSSVRYSKIGGHIRYLKKHLDAYIAESECEFA